MIDKKKLAPSAPEKQTVLLKEMFPAQLLKKIRLFMKSSTAKEEKHVTKGCRQQINSPSSSNQQKEKCDDDDDDDDDDEIKECSADDLKKRTKLFVGSLDHSVTSKELEVYFSRFGQVIDSVVLRHPKSGQSRGFGFVTFANPESVKIVLETKSHILDGKAINPQPLRSKSKKKNYEKCVFLGNLPFDCTEEDIKQFFGKYGEVEDVAIPLERKTMKSKGFGFLTLKDKLFAEKLLAQGFVNIKSRRISIKRADPPDYNKINVDLNVGSISDMNEYEGLEVCESFADEKFRHRRLSDDDISSVVSGEKQFIELKNKMDLNSQKLVENYFLNKFSNEKETKNKSNKVSDVGEVEKLLADFIINSSERFGTFKENLIEFSNESENISSETEEDTIDEEEDDTDDDVSDSDAVNFESTFQELSALNPNILKNKSRSYTEISKFNASAPKTSECFASQKSPMPFKIKDQEGTLVCSLCQWVSPESSCETFLIHCKTAAHRKKLKERFFPEKKQEEIPKTAFLQSSKQSQKKSSKPQALPEKQFSEKQNKNRRNPKFQKKEQKQSQSQQHQPQKVNELIKKKTSEMVEKKNKRGKRETQRSSELKAEKVKAFSIFALAKSMACIQPLSEDKIICKMCNKVMPKALDTSTLMKNISHHLQSKGHLNNVLEVERSLRKFGKNTDRKKMSRDTEMESSNEKNEKSPSKTFLPMSFHY